MSMSTYAATASDSFSLVEFHRDVGHSLPRNGTDSVHAGQD